MENMLVKYLPAESISYTGENKNTSEEEDSELDELPKEIRNIKVLNHEKGIEYCGDAEDYVFALETYLKSADDKAAIIENAFSSNNMEDFILNVHSLKSTSSAIGADSIFEKAKELEMMAKNGESLELGEKTEILLKEYKELKVMLENAFKE